jgi:hypothetical protein
VDLGRRPFEWAGSLVVGFDESVSRSLRKEHLPFPGRCFRSERLNGSRPSSRAGDAQSLGPNFIMKALAPPRWSLLLFELRRALL